MSDDVRTIITLADWQWHAQERDPATGDWVDVDTGPVAFEVTGQMLSVPCAYLQRSDCIFSNRS